MENNKLVRLSDVIAFVNDEHNQFDLEYEPYLEAFRQRLGSIPVVDAVEVVHGEWLWFEDCSNSGLYCSVCHKLIHKVMRPKKKLSNYCPNCSAKMDGGKKN